MANKSKHADAAIAAPVFEPLGIAMDNDLLKEYRKEAARIEEDSLHSSKGHYNASARWQHVHLWIGIPNAILAAIAGLSAFEGYDLFAGALAISVAAITAVSTFLNPGDRSAAHMRCAGEYHSLKNRSRIFINIVSKQCDSPVDISSKFEELAFKRDDLNATSPQIPRWAFEKAKAGIDAGEAEYRGDSL